MKCLNGPASYRDMALKGWFLPHNPSIIRSSVPLRGRLRTGRLRLTIDVLASQSLDHCPELY